MPPERRLLHEAGTTRPPPKLKAKPEELTSGDKLLKGLKDDGYGLKGKIGAKTCQQRK